MVGSAEARAARLSSTRVAVPGAPVVASAAGTVGMVQVTEDGETGAVPVLGEADRIVEPVGAVTVTTAPTTGVAPGLVTLIEEG